MAFPSLQLLSSHLLDQRKNLLRAWRTAIQADPGLTAGDALPKRQLNDHVPGALAAFERQLSNLAQGQTTTQPTQRLIEAAGAHGVHRWQQGYDLRQVTRELGHLNRLVVAEIDRCGQTDPLLTAEALASARQAWAEAYSSSVEESANQFFELQKIEATSHISELEQAARDVMEIERRRNDLWAQIAHDLRGNVGVVASASRGLKLTTSKSDALDQTARFARSLEKNVESLRALLDDITGLTRLQAGRETRHTASVDIGAHLVELCEGLNAFAHQRRLRLRHDGPSSFTVSTDAAKVRRIAQNLVLNALKYTEAGEVVVTWQTMDAADDHRWLLRVEDSGPGMDENSSSPLANALQQATKVAHEADQSKMSGTLNQRPELSADGHSPRLGPGEGLGLSIVKRLADLLDATIELQSEIGKGTAFTIFFPLDYELQKI